MEERLQKLMAQSGLGSRRACEDLIGAGRVTVNGRVAGLGDKADPQRDRILVDGQPLRVPEKPLYVAIYKPRGVLSTVMAPDPRPTVRDLVHLPGHLYPVGRLDIESEGLILLTNDGELANRLTHPRYDHQKEYRVLVAARPDEEQLATWRRGVVLDEGYQTRPADVRLEQPFGKGAWLRVILKEGRKRQIRETGSKLGLPVVKIIRVRIGSLTLGGLRPGAWRELSESEVRELKQPADAGKSIAPRRGAPSRRTFTERSPQSNERRPYGRETRGSSARSRPGDRRRPAERTSGDFESGRDRSGIPRSHRSAGSGGSRPEGPSSAGRRAPTRSGARPSVDDHRPYRSGDRPTGRRGPAQQDGERLDSAGRPSARSENRRGEQDSARPDAHSGGRSSGRSSGNRPPARGAGGRPPAGGSRRPGVSSPRSGAGSRPSRRAPNRKKPSSR